MLVVTSKTSQAPAWTVLANHAITFMQLEIFVLATAHRAQSEAGSVIGDTREYSKYSLDTCVVGFGAAGQYKRAPRRRRFSHCWCFPAAVGLTSLLPFAVTARLFEALGLLQNADVAQLLDKDVRNDVNLTIAILSFLWIFVLLLLLLEAMRRLQ